MGYGCVDREETEWARSETPVVLGGLPAGLSSGPRSRDRGYGCLGEGSGVIFPSSSFFPCPVRDEAMGTSPEEGV